jgi:hypothetical protein
MAAEQQQVVRALRNRVQTDSHLRDALAGDPVLNPARLDEVADQPVYTQDKWLYRIVVGGLVAVVVLAVVVYLAATLQGRDLPQGAATGLTALASAALGGLVGLFAPSPTQSRG